MALTYRLTGAVGAGSGTMLARNSRLFLVIESARATARAWLGERLTAMDRELLFVAARPDPTAEPTAGRDPLT